MKRHYFKLRILWGGDQIAVSLMQKALPRDDGRPNLLGDTFVHELLVRNSRWASIQSARIRKAQYDLIQQTRADRRRHREEKRLNEQLNSKHSRQHR